MSSQRPERSDVLIARAALEPVKTQGTKSQACIVGDALRSESGLKASGED